MLKRIITILTLLSFIFYVYGCYSISSLDVGEENIEYLKEDEITSVITKECELFEFVISESWPGPQITDSTLTGWIKTFQEDSSYKMKKILIPLSDIKTIYYEKDNTLLYAGLTVGIICLGVFIYFVTSIFNDTEIDYPIVLEHPLANGSL